MSALPSPFRPYRQQPRCGDVRTHAATTAGASMSSSASLAVSSITASMTDDYSQPPRKNPTTATRNVGKIACVLRSLKCSSRASNHDGFVQFSGSSFSDSEVQSLAQTRREKKPQDRVAKQKSNISVDRSASTDSTVSFAEDEPDWVPVFDDDMTNLVPPTPIPAPDPVPLPTSVLQKNCPQTRQQTASTSHTSSGHDNADLAPVVAFPTEDFEDDESHFSWRVPKVDLSSDVSFILDDLEDCFQDLTSKDPSKSLRSSTPPNNVGSAARFVSLSQLQSSPRLDTTLSVVQVKVQVPRVSPSPDDSGSNEGEHSKKSNERLGDDTNDDDDDEPEDPAQTKVPPRQHQPSKYIPRNGVSKNMSGGRFGRPSFRPSSVFPAETIDLAPVNECDEEDDESVPDYEENYAKHRPDSSSSISLNTPSVSSFYTGDTQKVSNTAAYRHKRLKTTPLVDSPIVRAPPFCGRRSFLLASRRVSDHDEYIMEEEQALIQKTMAMDLSAEAARYHHNTSQQQMCKATPSFFWRSNPPVKN